MYDIGDTFYISCVFSFLSTIKLTKWLPKPKHIYSLIQMISNMRYNVPKWIRRMVEPRVEHANQRKEEGRDQELIYSSTTPDQRHNMGKCQKHNLTSHTHESQEVSPFPAGYHKAAMNRQDSMT